MSTAKIWRILDAMTAAAERDENSGLRRSWENYISIVSMWEVWEEEGREYGDPAPLCRPSQRDLLAALASQGYRYSAATNTVIKK